jgi:malonyl CoA-acyl carrier protein transacylase/thioesterase domain-containing protein
LDAGAAVAGVIKTVLAMKHGDIPPSLNYSRPNPQIDFVSSPFYVNAQLTHWPKSAAPRRAGVSSFGLGGTNAHIILEEAPDMVPSSSGRSHQLLPLSARSEGALAQMAQNLADHIERRPDINLADVAFTLQTGRRTFANRRFAVCRDAEQAVTAFRSSDSRAAMAVSSAPGDRDMVFMFSGQGSQYVDMGLGLYEEEPSFRKPVDQCADVLRSHLSMDLRHILYPPRDQAEHAAQMLQQTHITQPALFTIEYALAQLWLAWGLRPQALVGHSIGEYVAACLAGVFSLEQALQLVSARGRLMQSLPPGSMLAVPLPKSQLEPFLGSDVCVAVVNGPALCVVSGETKAVDQLQARLSTNGVETRRLRTSHAFHSSLMEPILEPYRRLVAEAHPKAPQMPFLSNVTGTWITSEEATDPAYWARHLRQTVRFSACLRTLFREPHRILLEVGPGRTLATLARRHAGRPDETEVLSSIRHPKEEILDMAFILGTIGRLWLVGTKLEWRQLHAPAQRRRVSLPTYPFKRTRYWISPAAQSSRGIPGGPNPEYVLAVDPSSGSQEDKERESMTLGAPRNAMERSLVQIWQGLLGVQDLTIHENFFDIGGDSLLATRLFTRIASRFGEKLPLSTIFGAPTIAQLASILGHRSLPAGPSSLVQMRGGQARPPFYCLPGNLGNVFADLRYLAQHLGQDQPLYGLQDGPGHPSRVEELAAHYVEDIERVQPEGPYWLGGICSGAVVAFEMAQQLTNRHREVGFLALVEPAALPLPGARTWISLLAEIWERFSYQLGGESSASSFEGWREVLLYVRLRLKLIANLWASKRYSPRPYPGRLHLFLTGDSLENSHRLNWRDLAQSGADVHQIPGTHRSITGDHARMDSDAMRTLGEMLRACMDQTMQRQ